MTTTDAALARFKDLCIDAEDPAVAAGFWGPVLGLRVEHLDDGAAALRGSTPNHTVWISRVPEPKTAKHRIHLDIHCAAVDDLLQAGARIIDGDSHKWTVMADPEGGEFCAFTRDVVPGNRLYELGVDCADPEAQSRWWHEVIGGTWGGSQDEGCFWLDAVPDMPCESIVFVAVPEPKTAKNRVHIDVVGDAAAIEAHGADVLAPAGQVGRWTVMADPEGNEFCVFADEAPG